MSIELLPAIDIIGGRSVRLSQGEYDTSNEYGDPAEIAVNFANLGSKWIHLVDLDKAFGKGDNDSTIKQVFEAVTNLDINIELSGGIRNSKTLEHALSFNPKRVNIGTAALENPEWTKEIIGEYGDKIAIGLDVRDEILTARGWTKEYGIIWETIDWLVESGCKRIVVTDVNKDGMMTGPSIDLYKKISDYTTQLKLIASGGVSKLDDIVALNELKNSNGQNVVEGVITGKAIYSGTLDIKTALEAVKL
ncbi:MAG: bifunctional 1-(5-phosphoribosyl)-5-((5-phosphoribosylamino)methylideneamino)imidazole-4-carboxamide isomerase/phosphoribosylanthranilate isomerase PriA [Bifidobacteriaceae bacterium]|jgi:1-(5-phosphoribosyl)-5-[(5-phosphoribosylamino)methylideneamino] imidazole-4-carboxamide isomerase/N-(5'phosphoribosyl)anthranilate isomerase|nr:bifunctional 1-(5-phosphoribosyl)-5-((5-phosphoribosylamino)methylideneamino)imidazole-4-carboxamide isomerase/phosphoribosylanthranilate isomerase PriA [Bifidobacteriaceae bacterium]